MKPEPQKPELLSPRTPSSEAQTLYLKLQAEPDKSFDPDAPDTV